jgi:hypothetical protein
MGDFTVCGWSVEDPNPVQSKTKKYQKTESDHPHIRGVLEFDFCKRSSDDQKSEQNDRSEDVGVQGISFISPASLLILSVRPYSLPTITKGLLSLARVIRSSIWRERSFETALDLSQNTPRLGVRTVFVLQSQPSF